MNAFVVLKIIADTCFCFETMYFGLQRKMRKAFSNSEDCKIVPDLGKIFECF